MNWINTSVSNYYNWLREKTHINQGENSDWFLITTPFIGAFNDTIDLYAKKNGDNITLSDSGETLGNLELQGLFIQGSKKRKDILETILINYGISQVHDELKVECRTDNFAQAKHNFLSGITEINDLHVLSKHKISSIFKEDVRDYLDEKNIIYTPDFISKGSTGLEFNFDFQIAKKDSEIVIKSFNSLNKSNLPSFLFSWDDIKPVREKITKKEVKAIAFINDFEKEVKNEFLDALVSKKADYVLWSERHLDKNRLLVA